MIISVVAAKIWHLQKCTVFIGPPCILYLLLDDSYVSVSHAACFVLL